MASQITTAPYPIASNRVAAGRRLLQAYLGIANRPLLACAFAALLPFTIRLMLLPWFPVPGPCVQDEFSYLLGADTFASGRLANPPHALWQHFESFHILQQPVYASKYPPMQALALAAGQKLWDPWLGVLLSVALMCGCICWAMQGWLAPEVAFAGALLAALRLGISSYWANSYWGGAVAAIGGALILGAVPRLMRQPRRSTAFVFALGLVILANSRPYEGLLIVIPASAVLIFRSLRSQSAGALLRTAALPLLSTLLPAALAMGYYNHHITNQWLLMPYELHERQYAVAPSFLFQEPRKTPVYRNAVMKEFWTNLDVEVSRKAKEHWVAGFADHVEFGMLFFFGPLSFALITVLLPHPKGNLTDRLTFPILVVFLAGLLPEKGVPPHYWGPATGLLFVRFMNTIAWAWSWKPRGQPVGPALGIVAFLYPFLLSLLLLGPMLSWTTHERIADERKSVQARLSGLPGRHLVVVRYAPGHPGGQEWVYNRADIDSSRIVWARDLGDENNRGLRCYFANRSIWLLEPDKTSLPLVPY